MSTIRLVSSTNLGHDVFLVVNGKLPHNVELRGADGKIHNLSVYFNRSTELVFELEDQVILGNDTFVGRQVMAARLANKYRKHHATKEWKLWNPPNTVE